MKKTTLGIIAICLTLSLIAPLQSSAVNNISIATTIRPEPIKSPEADALIERLSEIKKMDKTALNHSEKKELRQEVHGIKKELNDNHGGVYLSVGGAILIVLLLILLF